MDLIGGFDVSVRSQLLNRVSGSERDDMGMGESEFVCGCVSVCGYVSRWDKNFFLEKFTFRASLRTAGFSVIQSYIQLRISFSIKSVASNKTSHITLIFFSRLFHILLTKCCFFFFLHFISTSCTFCCKIYLSAHVR